MRTILIGVLMTLLATTAAIADNPDFFYGRGGTPTALQFSTQKFGIKKKPTSATSQLLSALTAVPALATPTASQAGQLADSSKMTLLSFVSGLTTSQAKAAFAQVAALSDVDDVRPVYVLAGGYEELETPCIYLSFPTSESESDVLDAIDAQQLTVVKRIDYSAIGKIGYRLQAPSGVSAVAIADALTDTTSPSIYAVPVFCHLYQTGEVAAASYPTPTGSLQVNAVGSSSGQTMFHPYDPKYVGDSTSSSWPLNSQRQYNLYNDSGQGHINAPAAWNIIYQSGWRDNARVKGSLNQKDVVIASLGTGVMLDFRAEIPTSCLVTPPHVSFPAAVDCSTACVGAADALYYGHPDLAGRYEAPLGQMVLTSNQWFNPNPRQASDQSNEGISDDYFGWNFVQNDPWPYPDLTAQPAGGDDDTFLMAIADACTDNYTGVAGVCWNAKIMPVRYSTAFAPADPLFDLNMASAVKYAADSGAHVLSLQGCTHVYNPEIEDALLYARAKGCIIVVGSGNGNVNLDDPNGYRPFYPAILPEVVTVGGVNVAEERCTAPDWGLDTNNNELGSNYGWCLDLVAPSRSQSVLLANTDTTQTDLGVFAPWGANFPLGANTAAMLTDAAFYRTGSGTATAAAQVVGLAALLLTADAALSPAELQATMQWSAKHLGPSPRCAETGWGLIDCAEAVRLAMRPRFCVRNAAGKNVLSIDNQGNLIIEGSVVESATSFPDTSTDDIWAVLGNDGISPLAVLDPEWHVNANTQALSASITEWPTLYLKGQLIKQDLPLTPPDRSFVIEDNAGETVAYISSAAQTDPAIPAGSLVFKGSAFVGADPDSTLYVSTGVQNGNVPAADNNPTTTSSSSLAPNASASPITVPNVVGMKQAAAQAAIAAAGLTRGRVTIQYSPTVPMCNVISQSPAAGTGMLAGSAVALTVSLGPHDNPLQGEAQVWYLDNTRKEVYALAMTVTYNHDRNQYPSWDNTKLTSKGNRVEHFRFVPIGPGYYPWSPFGNCCIDLSTYPRKPPDFPVADFEFPDPFGLWCRDPNTGQLVVVSKQSVQDYYDSKYDDNHIPVPKRNPRWSGTFVQPTPGVDTTPTTQKNCHGYAVGRACVQNGPYGIGQVLLDDYQFAVLDDRGSHNCNTYTPGGATLVEESSSAEQSLHTNIIEDRAGNYNSQVKTIEFKDGCSGIYRRTFTPPTAASPEGYFWSFWK